MTENQKTVCDVVRVKGSGLHTGIDVILSIVPSEANTGINFVRVDLENNPVIKADVDNVTDVQRGTTISQNNASVSTVEHLLAALTGLGIDNCVIEVNAPEVPIMDGSSKPFIDAIKKVGVKDLGVEKDFLIISEIIKYTDPESGIELMAVPHDNYSVVSMIDFNSKVLGKQHATLDKIEDFEKEVSDCRTFCFLHELEYLLDNNLIKGGDLDNAIVVVDKMVSQEELNRLSIVFNKKKVLVKEEGILNNLDLKYVNEPARHKLLDIVGDLTLVGKPIKGKIIATKPGHASNVAFGKLLKQFGKKIMSKVPDYDLYNTVLDVEGIKKILPHRPPFLFVDRVIELTPERVVGVKNVSVNEDIFRGHFPGQPIFPGVLQVEAMAQVGGILVLAGLENPENYLTFFMKIEKVKFRKMVLPGDTIVFDLTYASPYRRGIAHMKGIATVNGQVVAEAEMMAKIQKIK
ncbi:MAG: UDP-3-O-[3-hydroxymyristoyl] N-acetylglucosamine deacetylase [Saprospiraceae bacterium]|jgi:UDP-3-O-[3-hydroxymyristoyl] N-acetylglucosamine deacetylase/3-hydroxyacyl-[acyl-carrier-protein] dehydratase